MVAASRPSPALIPSAARTAAVGTILCGLTVIVTTWTLLATGWVDGGNGALVVSLAAVLEAAVLAYARVPRTLALVLIPVLALAAIIPATIGTLPFDGDGSLLHLVARYIGAGFTGLGSTQDWLFTVGLCAVLWLCGYWMTWVALREHRGVLAVLPIYIVLATNVLNARTGKDPALPTILTVGFSLLVIANAHLDALQTRWQKNRVQALPGIRSGMVGSTAVIAVAILIAGSVLPRATSTDISGQFFTNGGTGGHGGRAVGTTPNAPATIGFNGDTQPGGPLVSNPKPVLTYTADTVAPIYLRVINDTDFSAGNWYPEHGGNTYEHSIAFSGVAYAAGSLPRDTQRADGAAAAATALVTVQMVLRSGATGEVDQVLFPGDPASSSRNGTAYGTVNLAKADDSLLTVDSVLPDAGFNGNATITTSGTISTATAAQLRAAGTNYPQFTQRYTQLLDDDTHGAARIASLARQWTASATNPYDAATAIEQHLRNPAFFTYTLSPPSAPPTEWPILFFLTDSHRGYCQYFASSMGAMLRSLGIPTRLVNGYGPGTTLATGNRKGQREQQVTTSDAHTWVEAYFPGYGWIPFEPTPPSGQGVYQPFGRGSLAVTGPPPAAPKPDLPNGFGDRGGPQATAPPPAPAPSHTGAWTPDLKLIGLSLLGLLALLLLAAVSWLLLPQTQRGAWRRLEVVGRVLGVRRRAHETHRAYALRFAALLTRQRVQGRARLAEVVGNLAQHSAASEFSRPGSDAGDARGLRRMWVTLFRASPRLAWRALARRGSSL